MCVTRGKEWHNGCLLNKGHTCLRKAYTNTHTYTRKPEHWLPMEGPIINNLELFDGIDLPNLSPAELIPIPGQSNGLKNGWGNLKGKAFKGIKGR